MGKFEKLVGESKEITHNGVRLLIGPLTSKEAAIMLNAKKKVAADDMSGLMDECRSIIENVLEVNFKTELDSKELTMQKMWEELPYKVLEMILFAKMETAGINVDQQLKKIQPPKE